MLLRRQQALEHQPLLISGDLQAWRNRLRGGMSKAQRALTLPNQVARDVEMQTFAGTEVRHVVLDFVSGDRLIAHDAALTGAVARIDAGR